MTPKEREDDTQFIPPVVATPAYGFPSVEPPKDPAARCGATDWAPCDDGGAHVYGMCNRMAHQEGRHLEMRSKGVWAEWSGDSGPVDTVPCEHTKVDEVYGARLYTAHPYADDSQGQPPARTRPMADERSGVSVGFSLFLVAVLGLLAATVWIGTTSVLENAEERQQRWTTRMQMDWTLARTTDANVHEACDQLNEPAWAGAVIDDFVLNINRNFPKAPMADRAEVAAYLDRVCTEPIFADRRTP